MKDEGVTDEIKKQLELGGFNFNNSNWSIFINNSCSI